MVLQNFYLVTKHPLDDGSARAPYARALVAPDMTKPAALINAPARRASKSARLRSR
jgi:hypothetical protein